ncbi:MAG TPA: glutamine-hydrolyzing GMP synthase [Casimicrobiaceae bacterium]|nr:glutamine-hydrolyzing GMP synthase [Casimicrobiaceae bacterium]
MSTTCRSSRRRRITASAEPGPLSASGPSHAAGRGSVAGGAAAPAAAAHDRILILDFGAQYTQLIARRLRETHVYCEIHPYDVDDAFVRAFAPKGIILSGGPNSVTESHTPRAPAAVFELGVPVLGICYGMQTMAAQLGGRVELGKVREFGYAEVRARSHSALLRDLQDRRNDAGHGLLEVWMSHGDKVAEIPPGFILIGSSDACAIAAMADESRNLYGVQFHPEVTHTRQGTAILARFAHDICGCGSDWNMHDYVPEAVERIRGQVGQEHVLLGLSGGVDSSVAAALIHRAIGDRLTCVFVDHGLLRQNEAEQVMDTFARNLGVRVVHVDASGEFMAALAGVDDPEAKRKVIGRLFVEVFQREAARIPGVKWLAQGTIYPDVIESAGAKTKKAHTIKSHHNVGGLPETLHLALLEPLRELFKDEVRELGLELGLPREMVFRHPFPGPGLGVRILGEVRREFADLLRRADAIFIDELRAARDADGASWYDKTAQAFAVFLPIRSVGVMGDGRTYEHAVALRAVQTTDFMTAHWAHLPHELIAKVSNRITNEVRGINRVVYDVSSKPPATIEWE